MLCSKLLIAAATSLLLTGSCVSVKYYQKERFADRTMIFDYDAVSAIIRADMVSTREASIGGFSSANAAGCSCK